MSRVEVITEVSSWPELIINPRHDICVPVPGGIVPVHLVINDAELHKMFFIDVISKWNRNN